MKAKVHPGRRKPEVRALRAVPKTRYLGAPGVRCVPEHVALNVCVFVPVSIGDDQAVMDEPLVGKGLAATLALLKSKGMIERASEEQLKKEKDQRDRMRWMAEQKARSLTRDKSQKDPEKARPPGTCGGRQRRWARLTVENVGFWWDAAAAQQVKSSSAGMSEREIVKRFENYKPDVNITYVDEFGRNLTPKEVRAVGYWRLIRRMLTNYVTSLGQGALAASGVQATVTLFPRKAVRQEQDGEKAQEAGRGAPLAEGVVDRYAAGHSASDAGAPKGNRQRVRRALPRQQGVRLLLPESIGNACN